VRHLALLLGAMLVTGCVSAPTIDVNATSERQPARSTAELEPCNPVNITTVIAQRLRVGVSEPFEAPTLFNAGPLGIQGYQADVMYAIASAFDMRPNEVVWVQTTTDANPIEVEVDFLLSPVGSRPDLAYSPPYGPDAAALAFAPGNPFLDCVTEVINGLKEADTFEQIEQKWLTTGE
jgi:ABC-type amino acid transport substrate-binding protein